MAEKYKTCKHSTGECGQTAVYVHPSCPAGTMICKTERHHTEMTIKTSPKWCPRRIKDGKK